jgi:hypothetical protein
MALGKSAHPPRCVGYPAMSPPWTWTVYLLVRLLHQREDEGNGVGGEEGSGVAGGGGLD